MCFAVNLGEGFLVQCKGSVVVEGDLKCKVGKDRHSTMRVQF